MSVQIELIEYLLLFSTQVFVLTRTNSRTTDNGRINETITLITAFVIIIPHPRKNKTALSS